MIPKCRRARSDKPVFKRQARGDRTRVTVSVSVPTHLFSVRTNSMASNASWPFASGDTLPPSTVSLSDTLI